MSDVHKVQVLMQSRQASMQAAKLLPLQVAAPSTHSRSNAMQARIHSDVADLAMADVPIRSAQSRTAGSAVESLPGTRAGDGYRSSPGAWHGTWLPSLAGNSGGSNGSDCVRPIRRSI
jgi:hypothetical protein